MQQSHLRFAPEILARLGEELVPHADLGIMELVRNAYDADATKCTLSLTNAADPGGTLVVSDNGVGMTLDQLASGFLVLGKSEKSDSQFTPDGRRKVGEKGLGRLAALRLGGEVEIVTRPESEPGRAHILKIDWSRFEGAATIEDVLFDIDTVPTQSRRGTTVTVSGLRNGLAQPEVKRLSHSLLLLTGPFQEENDFRIECDAPEFRSLHDALGAKFISDFEYRLVAELDVDGQLRADLYNWRNEVEFHGEHHDVALSRTRGVKTVPVRFFAPPASFELRMYNLNPSRSHEVRLAQQDTEGIRRWLQHVGGVHLYHRSLRVQPYGDPGNDWLGLNLRRASSPEVRPSTNTSVGRIRVDDLDNLLRPKTDRSGFVESTEFHDLQDFAKRALDWAAAKRLDKREQRRVGQAAKQREKAAQTEIRFRAMAALLAPEDEGTLFAEQSVSTEQVKELAALAIETIEESREETAAVREDLMLYRSLATVGTSTAVFAHESLKPSGLIKNEVQVIRHQAKQRVSPGDYEEDFKPSLDLVEQCAETVGAFARLPLSLLEKVKRTVSDVDIDESCKAAARLFDRFVGERDIEIALDLGAPGLSVRTTVADIESIVSNLIANAAHALTRTDAPQRPRVFRLRTIPLDDGIEISADDSGPGIHDMPLPEIWLPGRTARNNGTGLGLTIVRDIVADLNGRREAFPQGELGGASIRLWLPTVQLATTPEGAGS